MTAYPTFLATPVGLVGGLLCLIIAFLALRICAAGLGTTQAMAPEIRARIVAFAARLLAFARTFARLAERARPGTRSVRLATPRRKREARERVGRFVSFDASRASRSARETFGWMAAFVPTEVRDGSVAEMASDRLANSRIAEYGASVAVTGARVRRNVAGRVSCDRGQTHRRRIDHRLRAGSGLQAAAGTTIAAGETLSKTRSPA